VAIGNWELAIGDGKSNGNDMTSILTVLLRASKTRRQSDMFPTYTPAVKPLTLPIANCQFPIASR